MLLEVRDLTVAFPGARGWTTVVDGVSFDVEQSSTVALVGESGSGKTVTALSLLGLTASQGARILNGSVKLDGCELVGLSERDLSAIRGRDVGVVFQQPIRSLDPAFTVGYQIAETLRRHEGIARREAWQQAVRLLDRVHISDPSRRVRMYPHQMSGGMCQRVMIAIAIACGPRLLIADEPTTALDVTVQARILELIREIQDDTGIGVIFVSHDLAVVAQICQRVIVMYSGQVVEDSPIESLFQRPRHPYTEGLLNSVSKPGSGRRYHPIRGSIPSPDELPIGCRFHPRCDHARAGRCDIEHPFLTSVSLTEHTSAATAATTVRCLRADELRLDGVGLTPTEMLARA